MIPPNDDRDDRMDELLMQGARDYNQPDRVPREEMWARIAEARARSVPAGSAGGRAGSPAAAGRRWTLHGGRGWMATAVAAGLLLAAGISIGRRMERDSLQPAATTKTASTPTPSQAEVARGRGTGSPDSTGRGARVATVPPTLPGSDTLVPRLREATRATQRELRDLASSATAARPGDTAAGSATGSRSGNDDLAYRLVVLQHLAGSEAMITAFRTSAHHGAVDAQIASWSRDLLSTTRMLEASPATQDPTMRRLLDDLDLVISQIVQYTTHGTHDPDELDLIEQSIAKRGVISKLRSTLPPRAPAAGA